MKIFYIYIFLPLIWCIICAYFGWRHHCNKTRYLSEEDNNFIVHKAWIKAGKEKER